jgi:hypothetical protein
MARKTPKAPAKVAPEAPPVARKPPAQLKGEQLHIRVTRAQKDAMTAAAEREGYELSVWVRALALRAAGVLPAR